MPRPAAPARIRIGHRYYAIRFVPDLVVDGDPCDGCCKWSPAEIHLLQTLDAQALAETFLHECLHAMHAESGLRDDSDEETFTTFDAKSLCLLWQDNPGAMRWWQGLLKAPR